MTTGELRKLSQAIKEKLNDEELDIAAIEWLWECLENASPQSADYFQRNKDEFRKYELVRRE